MKNGRVITAIVLCITLITAILSVCSYALLSPVRETAENAQIEEENENFDIPDLSAEKTDVISPVKSENNEKTDGIDKNKENSDTNAKDGQSEKKNAVMTKALSVPADDNEKNIDLGVEYFDWLTNSRDVKTYVFNITERGSLVYTLSHTVVANSARWKVSLYQKYNSNGFDGEEKWRLLNVLETNVLKTSDSSVPIGLQEGEYKLTVAAGSIFTTDSFTVKADFTAGTDYEIEYNDTVARYTEITPDIEINGSSCNFDGEPDTDWYMFKIFSPCSVAVDFFYDKVDLVSALWRVSLYNADMNELYSDNAIASYEEMYSGEIGLEPGCYYICVAARTQTDLTYTLSVLREKKTGFESEPNGSIETADLLTLNSQMSGAVVPTAGESDVDMFKLHLANAGYVKIHFSSPDSEGGKLAWRIKLLTADQKKIFEFTFASGQEETVTAPLGLGAGDYYISVDGNGLYFDIANYNLIAEFTDSAFWEKEYNNAVLYATPLRENTSLSGTVTDTENEHDDDFYEIKIESPIVVKIQFCHEEISGNKNIFSLVLLDSDQNPVAVLDENTGEDALDEHGNKISIFESSENIPNVTREYMLAPGTYYFKVTSGLYTSDIIYTIICTTGG